MKKIIIILWAMLFSFCTWAQGSERLRDHQIPAKLEGFFKYADSLGYRANVHYIQRETRKVSVSFSHFVRKDAQFVTLSMLLPTKPKRLSFGNHTRTV